MVEFTHYFIYGNPPEELSPEKYEEWASEIPKKFNMEVVYGGVSIGAAEDYLIVLRGKSLILKNSIQLKMQLL